MKTTEELQEENNILQTKLSESEDKYLRILAEFDNFRKRTFKEKSESLKYAGEHVILSVLPSLDNLERALLANGDDGIRIIYNTLLKSLQDVGVSIIGNIGDDFNPELHEAITQSIGEPVMVGKIVHIVEPGYSFNGKMIRYTKVVVGA